MTPYRTGKGKTYLARVHDVTGKGHIRSLGTTNVEEAREVEAFLKRMRRSRRWLVLQLIIDRKLTALDAFDLDNAGTLTAHAEALLRDLARAEQDARDVDLAPLVSTWNGKGRKSQSPKYVRQVRILIPAGTPFPKSRFTRGWASQALAALEVSGPTRNRYRAALYQFGRWLVERDILDNNPVRDVAGDAEHDPRMVYYTREQAKALIRALSAPYKALEALMAGTGMEWQAVSRARRRDVDLDERTVFADGGKNRWRKRTVVVTEEWAWEIVREHVRNMHPNALLFDVRDKQALAAHHTAAEAAKLHPSVLHDWRHSYAIWNLRDGIEPAFLRPQLGHAPSSTMLERVYQAWIPSPAERRQRAQKVADSASKPASGRSRRTS